MKGIAKGHELPLPTARRDLAGKLDAGLNGLGARVGKVDLSPNPKSPGGCGARVAGGDARALGAGAAQRVHEQPSKGLGILVVIQVAEVHQLGCLLGDHGRELGIPCVCACVCVRVFRDESER